MMQKTTFEVTLDQFGDITIQPASEGMSHDALEINVDDAAFLSGQLMGAVIRYQLAQGFGIDLSTLT